MQRTRNRQIMTIALIMASIVGLGVGFAAFSSSLSIKSGVSVSPDSSTFSVKFSSSATAQERNPIEAVTNPETLVAKDGEIDAVDATTISNLSVEFTQPDQTATYTFYARNTGAYLAYLNMIQVGEKTCTPGDGADADLVAAACEALSVSVSVGTNSVTKTESITNHTLAAGSSEEVIVTLEYAKDGARADGAFTVSFGDISLTYSSSTSNSGNTIIEGEFDTFFKTCTLLDGGIYEVGSKYLCQFDNAAVEFYLLSHEKQEDEYGYGHSTVLIAAENVVDNISYYDAMSLLDETNGDSSIQGMWGVNGGAESHHIYMPTLDDLNSVSTNGYVPSWAQGYYWLESENEIVDVVRDAEIFGSAAYRDETDYGVRPVLNLTYWWSIA
ncbi:MAG: hypothetical protein E7165_03390 [Firmicutes bacterium]|nr:hypothetical protein [Bacillota bacterium]